MTNTRVRFVCSLIALGALAACGGGSTSPSGVTVIVRDGGTTGVSGATITITGAGVNPKAVAVTVGQMEGGLGVIGAGQTKVTHAFANAGTCTFHDHLDDGNAALKGSITVQ
jgi:hypothetical protein